MRANPCRSTGRELLLDLKRRGLEAAPKLAVGDGAIGFFSSTDLADPTKEATLWGDKADPDKDGRDNLLEFALGLNPQGSESNKGSMETTVVQIGASSYASLVFRRRKNEPMLSYVPEVSADGQVWNSGSNFVKETSVTGLDSVFEAVVCQDLAPVVLSSPRFFRLRVVRIDL